MAVLDTKKYSQDKDLIKMLSIRNSSEQLSLEEITAIEDRLDICLPIEYRDFLLTNNGGRPRPDIFRFEKASGRYGTSCVHWFLKVDNGEYNNFQSYFETYKVERQRLPDELIPVANDPGGNLICIAVSGDCTGAVYFWDHDTECDDGEVPTYENVFLIANTFKEFLISLFSEES